MRNISPSSVCRLTEQVFASNGYQNLKAHFCEDELRVVLRDQNPSEIPLGKTPAICFELLPEEVMRINDLWVLPPFVPRQGTGRTWVNGCLREIAKKTHLRGMVALGLYTECSEGFWRSLPGWKEKEDHVYSYDIVR
jgi:hypothetical protein